MYDENGCLVPLKVTNKLMRSTGVINRVRRVHREELTCESDIYLFGLRLDFIIEAPQHMSSIRTELQMKIISSQLKTKVKGNTDGLSKSCSRNVYGGKFEN